MTKTYKWMDPSEKNATVYRNIGLTKAGCVTHPVGSAYIVRVLYILW